MSLKRWPWILLVALPACFDLGEHPADLPDDLGLDGSLVGLDAQATDGPDPLDAGPDDVLAPCVEGPAPGETGLAIHIESSSVDQRVLVVPAGSVVVWTNLDDMRHRMRSGTPGNPISVASGGFDSRDLSRGATYAHRFCLPHTWVYYCSSHASRMNGYQLIVE